jgi:hypothetical protein
MLGDQLGKSRKEDKNHVPRDDWRFMVCHFSGTYLVPEYARRKQCHVAGYLVLFTSGCGESEHRDTVISRQVLALLLAASTTISSSAAQVSQV